MRKMFVAGLTAALLASSIPAGAASLPTSAAKLAGNTGLLETVQFRDERRELRRERRELRDAQRFGSDRDIRRERRDVREARRDYRDERRYYNRGGRRYYRDSNGAEIFAGVVGGLALGAIAAGAANAARNDDAIDYCESRYRSSYDRRTGTFLARDGRRYRCP